MRWGSRTPASTSTPSSGHRSGLPGGCSRATARVAPPNQLPPWASPVRRRRSRTARGSTGRFRMQPAPPGSRAALVCDAVAARSPGVRADDDGGRLAAAALHARGVELVGPVIHAGGGVVVSIVGPGGERTMASDRGGGARLCGDELDPAWLECDHLHVSGYALAAEPMRTAAGRAVELAREYGARVSVDVAAATLVEAIGVETFRALLAALAPDVVFCNDDE